MKTSVNILVTCRKAELLPAALLVFKTIRRGFPTAGINVYGNALNDDAARKVYNATNQVEGTMMPNADRAWTHGEWIEFLAEHTAGDFWICDTDMVFFDEVENWFNRYDETIFAGRYEPPFHCQWTKAEHVGRLHPSLMWVNAPRLNCALRQWPGQDKFFNTVTRNLFRWHWVPVRERVLEGARADTVKLKFYDTCAGLFHALGGTEFTHKQNRAFEHLYCGSYLDLIASHMPEGFARAHAAVYEDPSLARGMHEAQKRFYENNGNGKSGVAGNGNIQQPTSNAEHSNKTGNRLITGAKI